MKQAPSRQQSTNSAEFEMTTAGQPTSEDSVPAGPAVSWAVVSERSSARFHVRDKLVTTVHGSLPVQAGSVLIASDSTVTGAWVSMDVSGIHTGHKRRDKDLQKPQFLDAATHPIVEVVVGSATATPTGFTAHATLCARGRSAPLDLTIETIKPVNTAATSPTEEVRIRVTGRLDRSPLAIAAPSFLIGRFLDLEADLTLRPEQALHRMHGPGRAVRR